MRRWLLRRGSFALLLAALCFLVANAVVQQFELEAWVSVAVAGLAPLISLVVEPYAQRTLEHRRQQKAAAPAVDSGAVDTLPAIGSLTDDDLLGVRVSLLPDGTGVGTLSKVFPSYVSRAFYTQLSRLIDEMSSTGGFALLVGDAATGKSRAAREVIIAKLPDWRLLRLTSGQRLTDLIEGGFDFDRTVIWLDDIHRFLGERPLEPLTVERVLARKRRCILIGTIWPAMMDQYMTSPPVDLHHPALRARDVLRQAKRVSVPMDWSEADLAQAERLGTLDPRLAWAAEESRRNDSYSVTQVLASAPELIQRWEQTADVYGSAVLTAAVELTRCGLPVGIPPRLLEKAAIGWLTSAQLATATPGWFTEALTWACERVSGTVRALEPHATEPASPLAYQPADILVQHAVNNPHLPRHQIRDSAWDLISDEFADTHLLCWIGAQAMRQRRLDVAERVLLRAAQRGDIEKGDHIAAMALASVYTDQGDPDAGLALARKTIEQAGDGSEWAFLMVTMGMFLQDHHQAKDEARLWYEKVVSLGEAAAAEHPRLTLSSEVIAMERLGLILGRDEPALAAQWLAGAYEAGRNHLGDLLAAAYCQSEQYDLAIALLRERCLLPEPDGQIVICRQLYLAVCLINIDELDEAEEMLKPLAAQGDQTAMYNLSVIHIKRGDLEAAHDLLSRTVAAGFAEAAEELALVNAMQGSTKDAVACVSTHIEPRRQTEVHVRIGNMFLDEQMYDEAERFYLLAADRGNRDAIYNLGVVHEDRDDFERALGWYRQADALGEPDASEAIAELTSKLVPQHPADS